MYQNQVALGMKLSLVKSLIPSGSVLDQTEQAQSAQERDVGAVGSQAILDQRSAAALTPDQDRDEAQRHESQQEFRALQDEREIELDHATTSFQETALRPDAAIGEANESGDAGLGDLVGVQFAGPAQLPDG